MNIFDLVESPTPEIFRRLYIAPVQSNFSQVTYADWVEIDPDKIKSYGRLSFNANNIGTYQDQFPSLQIELDNADGYFNETDDPLSVFYNGYSRYRSLAKLECGFLDSVGTEYPSNSVCFLGLIGQSINQTSDNSIEFSIENYVDKLFDGVTMGQTTGFPQTTAVYYTAWEVLRYNARLPFESFVGLPEYTFSSFYTETETISVDLRYNTYVSDSVADITMLEFFRTMAQLNRQKFYQSVKGTICLSRHELDEVLADVTGSLADTNCIFHATLNDTLGAEIIDTASTAYLTCTSATPVYAAGYHSNGFLSDLSGLSYLQLNAQNNFNPQRFCIQYWYQPQNFNVSDGTAPESIAMFHMTLNSHYGYDEIKAGFSYHNLTAAAAVGELIIEKTNKFGSLVFGDLDNYSWLVNSNTALNLTAGANGFFAFVHDAAGIGGTVDIWRLYFAHENDTEVTLLASESKGSSIMSGSLRVICGDDTGKTISFIPLSAGSATGTAVIDDIKIYDYAKTDFSDFKTEAEYFKKKKYYVQGPMNTPGARPINIIGDISWRYAYDKIVNDITVDYSDGSVNYGEGSTPGIDTSAGRYGIKAYSVKAPFVTSGAALGAAVNIYNEYSTPRLEVTAKLKFFPYINIFDEMLVNYQTPVKYISSTTEYYFNENFESYPDGTSLIGAADHEFTERVATATLTCVATSTASGNKVMELYDSTDAWAGVTYNNADTLDVAQLAFDVVAYPGGRWGATYRHSAGGGLAVQHIPGSELRIWDFTGFDPIGTYNALVANWDAYDPGSVSSVRIDLSTADEMTLFIDDVSIATYTNATYTGGTVGFLVFGADGMQIDNVQIYSLGVDISYRQLSLEDKTMQVVKVGQDFDKLETEVVLREIL